MMLLRILLNLSNNPGLYVETVANSSSRLPVGSIALVSLYLQPTFARLHASFNPSSDGHNHDRTYNGGNDRS